MALKLGELVAYLKADNSHFDRGLNKAEKDFKETGRELERQAVTAGEAMGAGLWRGADGRMRDGRDRFAAAGSAAGIMAGAATALGFLGRFGAKVGGMLPDSMSKVFGGMPPQVQAAVVAAAVAIGVTFAAAAGAAIAAGMLLAVGGGVLAAGIKSASDAPAVKAAWKKFGDQAKGVFKEFGKPFEGPMKRAAETFGGALTRMEPTLKSMGKSMAPIIDKLAPAFASMAEKALPGIQKAMEASKPLFEKIAEHAPKIGAAISKFFDKIAEGGPGATVFLDRFLTWLEGIIIVLGVVIGWLAKMFLKIDEVARKGIAAFAGFAANVINFFGDILTGAAKAFGWMPGIGPKLKTAATEFEKFRNRANAALAGIQDRAVRITVEQHYKTFGKPGTSVNGIGGNDFKGRAAGGPVQARTPYIVGEKGWEVFVPDAPGRIVPHHEAAAARSSSGTTGGGGLSGTLRVILQWPDGRIIRDQLVDAASLRGQSPGRYLSITPA